MSTKCCPSVCPSPRDCTHRGIHEDRNGCEAKCLYGLECMDAVPATCKDCGQPAYQVKIYVDGQTIETVVCACKEMKQFKKKHK